MRTRIFGTNVNCAIFGMNSAQIITKDQTIRKTKFSGEVLLQAFQ